MKELEYFLEMKETNQLDYGEEKAKCDAIEQGLKELAEYKVLEKEVGCPLEEGIRVLYILITKELDVEQFRMDVEECENSKEALRQFNLQQWTDCEISKEEFNAIKKVYYAISEKFYELKDKSEQDE